VVNTQESTAHQRYLSPVGEGHNTQSAVERNSKMINSAIEESGQVDTTSQ
jgi:hypothetical protein